MSNEMAELLDIHGIIQSLQSSLSPTSAIHSRHKREAVNHITAVIQEIQKSLENIETSLLEHDEITQLTLNDTNSSSKIGAKCFIELNGQVNCSDIIYEDEKSWRKSRNQIDLLIKVLKNKINDLKDIKKHLKENKPFHMKDIDDDGISVEDDDISEMENQKMDKKEFEEIGEIETNRSRSEDSVNDPYAFVITEKMDILPIIKRISSHQFTSPVTTPTTTFSNITTPRKPILNRSKFNRTQAHRGSSTTTNRHESLLIDHNHHRINFEENSNLDSISSKARNHSNKRVTKLPLQKHTTSTPVIKLTSSQHFEQSTTDEIPSVTASNHSSEDDDILITESYQTQDSTTTTRSSNEIDRKKSSNLNNIF